MKEKTNEEKEYNSMTAQDWIDVVVKRLDCIIDAIESVNSILRDIQDIKNDMSEK